MKLTKCEADQFIEFMRLWFARNGGVVETKIKTVDIKQENDKSDPIMPKGFSKHTPLKEFCKYV